MRFENQKAITWCQLDALDVLVIVGRIEKWKGQLPETIGCKENDKQEELMVGTLGSTMYSLDVLK